MTANTASKNSLARVDELDGLRGLLALWVALSHIFCWCGFSQFPQVLPGLLRLTVGRYWTQFSFAASAVDTFIILSGFAISYLLHARPLNYRQFMTNRFFRIYPVYLICLLAGFATIFLMSTLLDTVSWRDNEYFRLYVHPNLAAARSWPGVHLLAHLTLLFGLIPEKILLPFAPTTLLPPAWSISLEWQYYLLAPLIALWVRRPIGILALGLVSAGELVYSHFWGGAFLLEKLPLFLIGIASFHLYANRDSLKNLQYRPHLFAAALAGTVVLGWHSLALSIWFTVFAGVLANEANPAERLLLLPRRFLVRPSLQFIGKISYPLYLVHWPVIIGLLTVLISFCPNLSAGQTLLTMLLLGLPIILLAAWLLHKWVEAPMMRVGKKWSQ